MNRPPFEPAELLVCTTCCAGRAVEEQAAQPSDRPGARLKAALAAKPWPAHITVRGVPCLANCDRGCSIALRGGAARWTYIYGNFAGTGDADLIHAGATQYAATADGLVPWRARPLHFRKNCIARIPPQELPQ